MPESSKPGAESSRAGDGETISRPPLLPCQGHSHCSHTRQPCVCQGRSWPFILRALTAKQSLAVPVLSFEAFLEALENIPQSSDTVFAEQPSRQTVSVNTASEIEDWLAGSKRNKHPHALGDLSPGIIHMNTVVLVKHPQILFLTSSPLRLTQLAHTGGHLNAQDMLVSYAHGYLSPRICESLRIWSYF